MSFSANSNNNNMTSSPSIKPPAPRKNFQSGFSRGFLDVFKTRLPEELSHMSCLGLIKCTAMQGFLEGYRLFFDPTYCHPDCLLRLVAETEPEHFMAHR